MKKYALAPCSGMSPNGLVARVAVGDCRVECENVISICMGSTSADIEGKNDAMLKKQDIIAVNGCANNCVNAILENRGIEVTQTVNVGEVLNDFDISARDPFRLDDEAEKCVFIVKEKLNEAVKK